MRTPPPSAPTLVVPFLEAAGPSSAPESGTSASDPSQPRFARGERVEVLWNGRWWPAVVIESRSSSFLVHYEGYADDWDETVDAERIRERGPSAEEDEPVDDDP